MPQKKMPIPNFEQVLIENREDGYWLDTVDINGDGRPDLVASGLETGEVAWYENPTWEKHVMATLPKPVAWDYADIDGDGRLDVVICHNFGGCPRNCKPEDGKISWLRNPGEDGSNKGWEVYPIANLMGTHRVKIGHFTQDRTLEVLGLPVVGPGDVRAPCPLVLYPAPENVYHTGGWDGTVVDDSSFRLIHDAIVGKYGAKLGPDLDSVLLSSAEGATWLSFGPDGGWNRVRLGLGKIEAAGGIFTGTGNVALGRIGDDPYAYIAALEPFHGNTVAVYTKDASAELTSVTWRRTELDIFGEPNQLGEGTGHHIVTADFDGDGDDEFLVGLRGPAPWEGVFYYKAVDPENGLFVKTRVSSSSTSMIAVADFDGDGRPDFATIGYYAKGFFLADNPQILLFLNRFG